MKKIFLFIFFLANGAQFANGDQSRNDLVFLQDDKKIAIMLVGYNRPHYLRRVLLALNKNPEAHEIPIYFFIDGGPESLQKENLKIAKSFLFPNIHFILRNKNYGCEKNIIDARRILFDQLGFEKVIVLEDDLVIAPNYIRLLLNLYKWSKQNLSNVGLVSGWNQCLLDKENKKFHVNEVLLCRNHLWGYLIDRECWDKIKNLHYEYEELFLKTGKSHYQLIDQIHQWIKQKIEQSSKVYIPPKGNSLGHKEADFLSNIFPIGQDGILYLGFWLEGLTNVSTVVNRLINIGRIGEHTYTEFWDRYFKDITLDVFDEDQDRTEFVLTQ